jgi:hypothetical protein
VSLSAPLNLKIAQRKRCLNNRYFRLGSGSPEGYDYGGLLLVTFLGRQEKSLAHGESL